MGNVAKEKVGLMKNNTTKNLTSLTPWQRRRWQRCLKFEQRYYEAILHQDLFGDWVVTRVNGRIATALGKVRHTPVESYAQGMALLDQINKQRSARKYQQVNLHLKACFE